jgi:dihydroxyacetone kinase-like predicted kinase
MYLLRESDDALVGTLRDVLDELGDSVLVVGGPQVWNVHAHVDDGGAAIEAGLDAGRP